MDSSSCLTSSEDFPIYYHAQEPEEDELSTLYNMHQEFAHKSKPLRIFKYQKYPEIVGQAIEEFYKSKSEN